MAAFVSSKATALFMLNLSDLKPAVFMVDTVMRFLWDPSGKNHPFLLLSMPLSVCPQLFALN